MGGDAVHSTAGGTLEPTLGSRLPYPHRQHDVASSRLNHLAQHLLPAEPERKIERDSHRMLAVLQREVLGDSGESGEHPHDGIRGGRPVPWPARRTIHELPPPEARCPLLCANGDQVARPPQREDRAPPAAPRRRVPLRPRLRLRERTEERDQRLEPPLQLPSTPHHPQRSTPSLTPLHPRQQRHGLIHLDRRAAPVRRPLGALPRRVFHVQGDGRPRCKREE